MFRDIATAILSALSVIVIALGGAGAAHAAHTTAGHGVPVPTAAGAPDLRPVADPVTDPRVAAILATAGDYEPTAATDVLTGDQWDAMLDVYAASEAGAVGCTDAARTLMIRGDYVPAMAPCLGDEDSRAVDVLLTLGGH